MSDWLLDAEHCLLGPRILDCLRYLATFGNSKDLGDSPIPFFWGRLGGASDHRVRVLGP